MAQKTLIGVAGQRGEAENTLPVCLSSRGRQDHDLSLLVMHRDQCAMFGGLQ